MIHVSLVLLQNECMNLGYDVEVLRAGKIKFKKLQALAKRHGINAKAKNAQVMIDKLVAKWELACSGKTDDAVRFIQYYEAVTMHLRLACHDVNKACLRSRKSSNTAYLRLLA